MTEPFDWSTCSPDTLAASYMQFRQAKSGFDAKSAECKQVMNEIEQAMLKHMQASGTSSFKVDGVATVTRTVRNNVSCADWSMFFSWLLDRAKTIADAGGDPTQIFSFLQKRVSSTEVEAFMQESDTPPPFINVLPEYSLSVRTAK
ncbi:hypothetical protein V757_11660 [Pelistega indica]|uniref:Uncharacterized protein n=1 Tax=Pelistega indica TaxID=1414851 RepID=V8FTZ6_9BURK|nr:hypothetical protein [Pelistega indica]ETD67178.1 hypothetical protein V757_11660 [Pelistega indica]